MKTEAGSAIRRLKERERERISKRGSVVRNLVMARPSRL